MYPRYHHHGGYSGIQRYLGRWLKHALYAAILCNGSVKTENIENISIYTKNKKHKTYVCKINWSMLLPNLSIRAASNIAGPKGSSEMYITTIRDHLSALRPYPYKLLPQRQQQSWVNPIFQIIGACFLNNESTTLMQWWSTPPASDFFFGRLKSMQPMDAASAIMIWRPGCNKSSLGNLCCQ